MKRRALIYPYNSECAPIIKNRHLLVQHDIVYCVSPIGYGLHGKDASFGYGGETAGIIVTDEIVSWDFDDLIICESTSDFEDVIMPQIVSAAENSKNIILLYKINNKLLQKVKDICIKNNVKLTLLEFIKVNTEKLKGGDEVLSINTPVIFVTSVIENTNKFDIQLCLRDHFINEGFRVSQLGTKQYCELFGFHSIPELMFTNQYNEKEKIVLFNRVCKSIEIQEKPDVIIIGVPGATMVFNNIITNNFGIVPFEIANAVHPDAAIMSITHENYDAEFLEMVKNSTIYKLGFEINCFNMANRKFDSLKSKEEKRLRYITVDTEQVDKKIQILNKNSTTPIFNSLNSDSSLEMCKCIENYLSVQNFETV